MKDRVRWCERLIRFFTCVNNRDSDFLAMKRHWDSSLTITTDDDENDDSCFTSSKTLKVFERDLKIWTQIWCWCVFITSYVGCIDLPILARCSGHSTNSTSQRPSSFSSFHWESVRLWSRGSFRRRSFHSWWRVERAEQRLPSKVPWWRFTEGIWDLIMQTLQKRFAVLVEGHLKLVEFNNEFRSLRKTHCLFIPSSQTCSQ